MNILEAKQEIKNTVKAYLSKNNYGEFLLPVEKQRPIFMMGAPGIGKTAIMEQIASELKVGLISYSMTHHTRQSALGLPFIEHKNYGGLECDVSTYTMSEIVASVYETIEKSGVKEGILFLDEINCVSETLAPIMLQFLQYKIFGKHSIPKGWVVVTAGNPPEYNNSVREFDIATWDRLKRIDVEPDYSIWKEYAYQAKVHASILAYLDSKRDAFYKVETNLSGKSFVTARAWEDLSQIINLYELNDIEVNKNLVAQYIQDQVLSRDYANYLMFYNKTRDIYDIPKIVEGAIEEKSIEKAKEAKFDEKITVVHLFMEYLSKSMADLKDSESYIKRYKEVINEFAGYSKMKGVSTKEILDEIINKYSKEIDQSILAGNQNFQEKLDASRLMDSLIAMRKYEDEIPTEVDKKIKSDLKAQEKLSKDQIKKIKTMIDNTCTFIESAFGEGHEINMLMTELTTNYYSTWFIANYGSDSYGKYSQKLLITDRIENLNKMIDDL